MTPNAIQKKICMVGSYGVGKTSLVRRFVESIFSDSYLTNIGVRIDRKQVTVEGQDVNLVLWDLAGEDEITQVRMSHLRGSSGYILVADGCRTATLDKAFELHERIRGPLGNVPWVLALNKADLLQSWEVPRKTIDELQGKGWTCLLTSAKTGDSVDEIFFTLASEMLSHSL